MADSRDKSRHSPGKFFRNFLRACLLQPKDMPFSESVTQMLIEWNEGDESALERLTPLVYDELRRRAAAYLRRESDAETLQATALVHEAYLQILDFRNIDWKNRSHFINMIALLMR